MEVYFTRNYPRTCIGQIHACIRARWQRTRLARRVRDAATISIHIYREGAGHARRIHAVRDRAAHEAGVSQKELAARYHLTRPAISLVVLNKPLPPSKKHAPVVSAELAAAIRDEYATGRISLAKLAARHHLTIHHINQTLAKRVPGGGKRRQLFLSAD
jgi:hypothetical protein